MSDKQTGNGDTEKMARKRRSSSKALERRVSEKSEELKRKTAETADAIDVASSVTKEEAEAKTDGNPVPKKATGKASASSDKTSSPAPSDPTAKKEDGKTGTAATIEEEEEEEEDKPSKEESEEVAPSTSHKHGEESSDVRPADSDVPDISTDKEDTEDSGESSHHVTNMKAANHEHADADDASQHDPDADEPDVADDANANATSKQATPAPDVRSKVRDIESTIDDGIDEAMEKIEASIDAITDDTVDDAENAESHDVEDEENEPADITKDATDAGTSVKPTSETDDGNKAIPDFLKRHAQATTEASDADGSPSGTEAFSEVTENEPKVPDADGESGDTDVDDPQDGDVPEETDANATSHDDSDSHDGKDDATEQAASENDREDAAEDEKLGKVAAETVATAAGAAASAVSDAFHDAASATADKTKDMAKATSSALASLRDRMRKASEERHQRAEERRKEREEERKSRDAERERAEREASARESQTKGTEDELHEAGVDATIREVSEQNGFGNLPPVRVYIPEEDEPMPRPVPHHERFSVIMADGGMVPARPFTERELSRRVSAWAGTKERYASRRFVGVALVVVLGLGLLIGAGTSLYTARAIEDAAQRATRTINWSGGDGASYAPDANKVSDDQSGKAYKMGSEASVAVIATDSSGKAVGHWSGTIVDGSGHVVVPYVTASYANGGTVRCYTADGKGYTAEVTGTDAQGGLATLTIGYSTKPDATLADSSTTRVGQWAMVVSRESGTSAQAAAGIVSSIDSTSDIKDAAGASIPLTLIRTDIPADDVLAGSPVMDSDGSIIGIAVSTSESVVYAIPSNYVATSAKSMIASGSMEHASLGVSLETDGNGLTISDAGTSGMEDGDTIVSVAGTAVSSEADVTRVLMANKPGDTIAVTVRNARGANETLNVELAKATDAGTLG